MNTTLIVQPSKVIIQKSDSDDDAILEEWTVPFIKHGPGFETTFKISSKYFKIIKKDYYIIVYENFFETSSVRVEFEKVDYLTWDTFSEEVSCIMVIPEMPGFSDDEILLSVDDNFSVMEDGITHVFRTIKSFQKGTVRLIPSFFEKVMKPYKGKVCRLFVQKDNPLCVRFDNGHRIFVAPVV